VCILEAIVCNDVQESRINKLHNVMSEYIPNYKNLDFRLVFTQNNALNINEPDMYNKVNRKIINLIFEIQIIFLTIIDIS